MQSVKSILFVLLATAFAAPLAGADLPAPPSKDVPYIIHATNLLETESNEATEEADKKQQIYHVPGVSSPVKTPLGFPEFLFAPETIKPETLELYRFEPNGGRREILVRKKKKVVAQPYILNIEPRGEGVVRIRVNSSLESGEYCLTPNGSNAVFCFGVT